MSTIESASLGLTGLTTAWESVAAVVGALLIGKEGPELREADLSEEQAAVVRNMAATSDELAPGQRFASRELVEHQGIAACTPVWKTGVYLSTPMLESKWSPV